MIVQGTNLPLILTFDEDASTFQDLSVTIYPRSSPSANPIKMWELQDVIIDENEVLCPIAQQDFIQPTLDITEDLDIIIEITWLGEEDTTENVISFNDYIAYRKDSTILTAI